MTTNPTHPLVNFAGTGMNNDKLAIMTANTKTYYNIGQDNVFSLVAKADALMRDFPSAAPSQLAELESMFTDAFNRYKSDTSQMEVVNNLKNVTDYITSNVDKEQHRMNNLRSKTFSDVHKMREHYMLKKYDIAYNTFLSGIIQFTLFVVIVCGFVYLYSVHPKNPISSNLALGIIAGIALLYIVIIVLYIKQSLMRRKDDWNKYYFGSMDSSSGSCA